MQIRRKKHIRPLILSAVLLFYISGCSTRTAGIDYNRPGSPAYGDAIVIGSIGDATTLIPIVASDSASHDICGLVYSGLIKYDKDLNIVGELAESWEIEEDGKIILFRLRKDVKWHDGVPFTAEDVKFTYEKLIDPDVRTPYSGDFLKIEKLEVLDPHTVKVIYGEPFSPALSSWGMWIMPKHILKGEDLNTTKYGRNPIGTGPYKFIRWKSGERIDLVSNEDYFEGRSLIDRYIYRIIPDNATMFLEIQAEGVDMMGLAPLQYQRQTDNNFFKTHYNKFRYPAFGYTYLGYNLLDEKFKDKRVRQALNLAVDKQSLIDGVLMGLGRVCTGPFVPESWAYNKDVVPAAYNPERARQLLLQAGWIDNDKDGWLDKNGKTFEFTIITNQGNDERRRAAEIIQRSLSEIGIKVKIKILEWSVFITEVINKRKFEAVLLGWGLGRDPDSYDIWHSSKIKEGEFNFILYKNEGVDRLLEEGRRIFDQNQRAEIYHKMQRVLYDEQPYMFLWVADSLPIVHKRFKNILPAPAGIGYNFIKWYVPLKQQKYKR
ncbi:MAG: peptide-binding protein [Candidatus Omnitrophica bacterium]|nr:peptide-binding protein [Candidatus Omnitrophota bacterium]